MRKPNSTNSINKTHLETQCGMAYTISVLSGRWKLSILGFLLDDEKLRYTALKSKLTGISEKMLASQLKELEKDGLLERQVHANVPPTVEYRLSEKGKTLREILMLMSDWGDQHGISKF